MLFLVWVEHRGLKTQLVGSLQKKSSFSNITSDKNINHYNIWKSRPVAVRFAIFNGSYGYFAAIICGAVAGSSNFEADCINGKTVANITYDAATGKLFGSCKNLEECARLGTACAEGRDSLKRYWDKRVLCSYTRQLAAFMSHYSTVYNMFSMVEPRSSDGPGNQKNGDDAKDLRGDWIEITFAAVTWRWPMGL